MLLIVGDFNVLILFTDEKVHDTLLLVIQNQYPGTSGWTYDRDVIMGSVSEMTTWMHDRHLSSHTPSLSPSTTKAGTFST
jgi:hypothetical protein